MRMMETMRSAKMMPRMTCYLSILVILCVEYLVWNDGT